MSSREGLGDDGRSRALAEQGADVAAAQGEVSGTQAASIRCAQGREQEEEAGEMAVAQTHVLSMLNEMRVELESDWDLGCFREEARRTQTGSAGNSKENIRLGSESFEYP